MKLLEDLSAIHSPTGEEFRMKEFILNYVQENSIRWKVRPEVISEGILDGLILKFGQPRTAIFAHIDTIGFTCRYENQLVPIGSPDVENGIPLTGKDAFGEIECKLVVDGEGRLFHDFPRSIQRGTTLVFKRNLQISNEFIQSPYMDNRLGIYNALKVAETLENGVIAFSTHEEHGGGSVPKILNLLQNTTPIKSALISDITWVTDGVGHGKGVVISMRDQNVPRRKFVDQIIEEAEKSQITYQVEVEGSGSSDGREIHISQWPINWCFIGAPEDNVHSPYEKVHIDDLQSMIDLYCHLMKVL